MSPYMMKASTKDVLLIDASVVITVETWVAPAPKSMMAIPVFEGI